MALDATLAPRAKPGPTATVTFTEAELIPAESQSHTSRSPLTVSPVIYMHLPPAYCRRSEAARRGRRETAWRGLAPRTSRTASGEASRHSPRSISGRISPKRAARQTEGCGTVTIALQALHGATSEV